MRIRWIPYKHRPNYRALYLECSLPVKDGGPCKDANGIKFVFWFEDKNDIRTDDYYLNVFIPQLKKISLC
jgi:hypothetical protein